MKPECEKSRWEKFKDGCKKVGEWCKNHWKAAITIVIVIAAAIWGNRSKQNIGNRK